MLKNKINDNSREGPLWRKKNKIKLTSIMMFHFQLGCPKIKYIHSWSLHITKSISNKIMGLLWLAQY